MNFTARQARRRVLDPDITAMVDVVFLLIIFFLTTSSLVEIAREQLDLPSEPGEKEVSARAPAIVLNILEDGRLIVEGEEFTREQLFRKISFEAGRAPGGAASLDLLIRADRTASLRYLNDIATGLTDLGVRSWRLATEVPPRFSGGST